jgi:hypothetical protein
MPNVTRVSPQKILSPFFNPLVVTICSRGPVSRTATMGDGMQTFQSFRATDLKVVSRCRYAQIRGLPTTLRIKDTLVTGLVHSLKEDTSSNPVSFLITLLIAKRSAAA